MRMRVQSSRVHIQKHPPYTCLFSLALVSLCVCVCGAVGAAQPSISSRSTTRDEWETQQQQTNSGRRAECCGNISFLSPSLTPHISYLSFRDFISFWRLTNADTLWCYGIFWWKLISRLLQCIIAFLFCLVVAFVAPTSDEKNCAFEWNFEFRRERERTTRERNAIKNEQI